MPILRDLDPHNLPDVSEARLIPVMSQLLVIFGVNLHTLEKDKLEKIQADFLAAVRHLDFEDLATLNIASVLEKILEPLGFKLAVDYLRDDGFSKENLKHLKKVQHELAEIIKANQAALGKIGSEAIEANLKFSLDELRKEENSKVNPFDSLMRSVSQQLGLAQNLNNLAAQIKKMFVDLKNKMAQAGSTLVVRLSSGTQTQVRLKSAVLVDKISNPKSHQVFIGFKAPREEPKKMGRKFEQLPEQEKKEAACLATTHLLNQLEQSGMYSPAPRSKPRSFHIEPKTLTYFEAVAQHDARMRHLHQAFSRSPVLENQLTICVKEAEIQAMLLLMRGMKVHYVLPVSSAASNVIPRGPTPGVR